MTSPVDEVNSHMSHTKKQKKGEVEKPWVVPNGVREKWFAVSRHNKCTPGDMGIDPSER